MLAEYLELSYEKDKLAQSHSELIVSLKQLPNHELFKLATGRTKLASGDDWIEQFKGTPYFEQAVAMEQEQLQLDLSNMQNREQNRLVDDQRDSIEIKKRLLTLQAASGEQDQAQQAAEEMAMQEQALPVAEEKSAAVFAEYKRKMALAAPMGLGAKILGLAKANPAMTVGAVGGGLAGMASGDGLSGKLTGALGGAAGGAALGAAGQVGHGAIKTLARSKVPVTADSVGRAVKGSWNRQVRNSVNAVGGDLTSARPWMANTKAAPGGPSPKA